MPLRDLTFRGGSRGQGFSDLTGKVSLAKTNTALRVSVGSLRIQIHIQQVREPGN